MSCGDDDLWRQLHLPRPARGARSQPKPQLDLSAPSPSRSSRRHASSRSAVAAQQAGQRWSRQPPRAASEEGRPPLRRPPRHTAPPAAAQAPRTPPGVRHKEEMTTRDDDDVRWRRRLVAAAPSSAPGTRRPQSAEAAARSVSSVAIQVEPPAHEQPERVRRTAGWSAPVTAVATSGGRGRATTPPAAAETHRAPRSRPGVPSATRRPPQRRDDDP